MKKPQLHPMVFLTIIFLVFLLGLFLGRNRNQADVQVSRFLSAQEQYRSPLAETVPTIPNEEILLININTADATLLQTLPGIGEATALRIIDYRTDNGPYRFPTDLLRVEGFGVKKVAEIIDYITVQEDLS